MGADISRVRFDPHRNFAGVVMQQGRLLLDADFNEYVALLDRRLRAETSDLTSFGPDNQQGVAWVPRETPDGFRVTATAGDLSIGRGRMYVDGLLAENHGTDLDGFDPLLSERTGSSDTPYDEQPYWLTPDPLPSGGPHLAYIDVWQREVTHLEDPDLVEVAVGVDSTARLQTAWQVRLLPNVGAGVTCASDDDDIPGWLDVIRPSAGRLSTDTVDVDPTDDPCELPPSGGYRGLENQTYRVEIHEGGTPGNATFKWSRDNGSVAIPVVEMVSSTVLRLASVGKDDVLRISTGDWVEILDDRYELDFRPGVMRKVTVDDAARTITFTGALPADLQPANADEAAERHLRARRWDQSGVVKSGAGATLVDLDAPGSTGLIEVPSGSTTQVVLEHGVAVSFRLAPGPGGRFREGDYWIFAARTADTSVEILDEAPPLGVHHHYARLGLVTFPGTETDCRRLWPPLFTDEEGCDCTVCVTPELHSSGALTIQAAIDIVRTAGGTVCLSAGVYDVGAGLNADNARSVRIRGQGPATILVARGTAISAQTAMALTIENLAVVSGTAAAAAIRLRTVIGATVQDTVVLSYGGQAGGSGIELSGVVLGGWIRRNVVVGRTAIDGGGDVEQTGVLAAALRVEGNVVAGLDRGIDLGGRSAYVFDCRVTGNDVLAGQQGGIVATGVVAPGGTLDVAGNKIASSGGPGIEVGADATVDQNVVNRFGEMQTGSDGIVVAAGGFPAAPGHVRITGNRVHDRSGLGIVLRTPVVTWMVKQNIVTDVGAGIGIEETGSAEHVAVDNNVVVGVGLALTDAFGSALGIVLMRAESVAVAGNRVARLGLELSQQTVIRAGILVLASGDVNVSGNAVDEAGPPGALSGVGIGIGVFGPFASASLNENRSRYSPEAPAPVEGVWSALLVQSAASAGALRFGERAATVPTADGAIFVTGATAFAAAARSEHAGVGANVLSGGGSQPTCLVRVNGDVTAHGNQCDHVGGEPAGMFLQGLSASATGNRVRGAQKAMLVLAVPENRFAAVANLTAGGTHLGAAGNGLPAPWDALNPIVP